LCSDGSSPDADGNCGSTIPPTGAPPKIPGPPTKEKLTMETCLDGSVAADSNCITPTHLLLVTIIIGFIAIVAIIVSKSRRRTRIIRTPTSDTKEIKHTAESTIAIETEGWLE
jgi:hypothetical protein